MIGMGKEMYQQRMKQLKDRRLYLNYTLEKLAHIIGISDKMLGKWERGESIPNMQNFEAWCNGLDLTVILSADSTVVNDWQPNEKFIEEIKQQFKEVNYEYELENFKDWYRSKGDRSADWNALFRMWVRRSVKFNRGTTKSNEENTKALSAIAQRLHAG